MDFGRLFMNYPQQNKHSQNTLIVHQILLLTVINLWSFLIENL